MNISILLNDIASTQTDIDHHQLQAEIARRRQGEKLQKLGEILRAGLDRENFPLRLQLIKGYEIKVTDDLFEVEHDYLLGTQLRVLKSQNLDQATLMKLLEAIEE